MCTYVLRFFVCFGFIFGMLGINSCTISGDGEDASNHSSYAGNYLPETGGKSPKFKIPLLPGFNWEITQSWASHCKLCNQKGYDTAFNGFFGNYCTEMSHMAQCLDACKYGWDFNLPGNSDEGKSVLASGNGYVEEIGNNSWGNYVVINHGDDLCTRYAHLLDNSITVEKGQYACQGFKIGEIGGTPSYKPHLHFQFEECSTQDPVPGRFDDGNGIPVCTIGDDIFNAKGEYTALKLTNKQVNKCPEEDVHCDDGCLCDHGTMTCIDPEDQDPEAGGFVFDEESDEPDEADDSDDESNDESDESDEKEFDLDIECFIDINNTRCENPYTILYIKCAISNNGEEVVKINDLVMSMTDANAEGVCQVTDPNLNTGVGTKNIDPGEIKALNGHYEISCTDSPSDPEIEVKFDLAEKISGVVTWYYGLLSTSIPVVEKPFGDCENGDKNENSPCVPACTGKVCGPDYCGGFCGSCNAGQSCNYDMGQCIANAPPCVPSTCANFGYNCGSYNNGCGGTLNCGVCAAGSSCQNGHCTDACANCPPNTQCVNGQCVVDQQWPCDPNTGYKVLLSSPGGSFEIAASGPQTYYEDVFPPGMDMMITFACIDLPGAILLHGGLEGIQVSLPDNSLPPFSIWAPYFGELLIDPLIPPDTVMKGFSTDAPNLPILIRVPAN